MKKIFTILMIAAAFAAACEKNNPTTEDENTLVYAGVTYKTVTFENGATWMAENLRYIPAGKTVTGDPSDGNGIWYPYQVVEGTASALTDAASVEKYGYLYDYQTALGGVTLTPDNYMSFEGAQGICPEGWHIPTRKDFLDLCGASVKNAEESGNVYDEEALFYDAALEGGNIGLANDAGFNFVPVGAIQKNTPAATGKYTTALIDSSKSDVEEWYGRPALTYYMASTGYQYKESNSNYQFFGMMSTFTSAYKGRLTCAYTNYLAGYSLRCVKDAE